MDTSSVQSLYISLGQSSHGYRSGSSHVTADLATILQSLSPEASHSTWVSSVKFAFGLGWGDYSSPYPYTHVLLYGRQRDVAKAKIFVQEHSNDCGGIEFQIPTFRSLQLSKSTFHGLFFSFALQ